MSGSATELNDDALFLRTAFAAKAQNYPTLGSRNPHLPERGCYVCGQGAGWKENKKTREHGYAVLLAVVVVKMLDGRIGGSVKLCSVCETRLRALGAVVEEE